MSNQYYAFVGSVATASRHAVIIFLFAFGGVFAYHSLDWLNEAWRPFAKLIAWIYAVIILCLSIIITVQGG